MIEDASLSSLSGIVTKYKGNGRKFGYPTANFATASKLQDGVYFGYADMGKYHNHPALIFIGIPTTVGDLERRVEAHLLDIADKDYYGLVLTLDVKYFYRPSVTFAGTNELLTVMHKDEAAGRRWFRLHQ